MAITVSEYKSNIKTNRMNPPQENTPAARLLALLDDSEHLLFQGKESIQPVKIYQVKRIYQLAKVCIEIITLIWPSLRTIISLLKNIF